MPRVCSSIIYVVKKLLKQGEGGKKISPLKTVLRQECLGYDSAQGQG